MAFIPTANVARVSVEGLVGVVPVVNVMAFRKTTARTEGDMQDLAEAVYDAWEFNILPILHQDYKLQQVRAVDQTSEDAPTGTYGEGGTAAGGEGGDRMPLGCAVVATLRTAARGRTSRGRWFLAPLAEPMFEAGQLTVAYAGNFQGRVEAFWNVFAEGDWELGVLSLQSEKAPRAAGLFRPLTSVLVRSRVPGYQSRRTARK